MCLRPLLPSRKLMSRCALLAVSLFALGCGSAARPAPLPVPVPADPAAPPEDPSRFSADRAWRQLTELTRIGPRVSGSDGARRAREYLLGELEAEGVAADEQLESIDWNGRTHELTHVVGVIPGASSDVIALIAHYDTHAFDGFRFVGANDAASGVAMLLELARVLAREPHEYTIWLVFLDGDAIDADHSGPHLGTLSFAQRLADAGQLQTLRMAAVFDQVGDAELAIARDLRSHRGYRELFWDAATRIGRESEFPQDAGFASPSGAHEDLLRMGLRPVVAITDDRFGGPPPPGSFAHSDSDDLEHCSAASLAAVGEVTLEALADLEARLAKIDRFAANPLGEDAAPVPEESPAPEISPAPESAAAPAQNP